MSNKNDRFAQIAMTKQGGDQRDLVSPEPPENRNTLLPLLPEDMPPADWLPVKKMSKPEELRIELERWKKRYQPFLKNLAPPWETKRRKTPIDHFDWRVEEEKDTKDFTRILSGRGNWKRISIPHYGGPLGKAVTYYRTNFTVELLKEKEALFLCFKGADYKAHIFINGSYIGSHEGFFAPFEFDISPSVRPGVNTLVVKLENDHIFMGSGNEESQDQRLEGDKLYAATGPGYNESERGWHHCPPGMGLYQDVFLEYRHFIHIHDIYVRPMVEGDKKEQKAELWLEIFSGEYLPKNISIELSLYGQNFQEVLFEDREYTPSTGRAVGMGDSFTEQKLRAQGLLDKPVALKMERGINLFKIPFVIPKTRLWEPDSPWLYQIRVKILSLNNELLDSQSSQFGMRSFFMDTECTPKGMFYLNNQSIRLRGANTMGHEQQCVMKKDWNQLIEDLLLARICHMNFLRLTQRPVQAEVYELCDRLGLMTQTDLPLFGVLKRDRFCEAVRQTEEMERLVRSHPCNILISYINEPFPNSNNKPHRHLERTELLDFFKSADIVVKLNNPDRVIKHVDGDYDPPSETLPDNHCYNLWYNGHGLDAGKLHRGYWMAVKKDWNYGCGEFGVEGLESVEIMKKHYPDTWLPHSKEEEENWSPNQIVGAQSGNFHYLYYETPHSLDEWVQSSQAWQAEGLKLMTEAFRRDPRMVTFAVHLFIDAFPSGWMKTIMDCERNPKPSYFAYRNALEPLLISLRTDRYRYTSKETIRMECWICHDRNNIPEGAKIYYKAELQGKILFSGEKEAHIPSCSSSFQGYFEFPAPRVRGAEEIFIKAAIIDNKGKVLCDSSEKLKIFPDLISETGMKVYSPGRKRERELIDYFKMDEILNPFEADLIIIDDYSDYQKAEEKIMEAVKSGAHLLFLNLPPGEYNPGDNLIEVKQSAMMPIYFAAPAQNYKWPKDIDSQDFRFWYESKFDRMTPLLINTCSAKGFTPLLTSGNINSKGDWGPALAVGEKSMGKGKIIICQLLIEGRIKDNPPAAILLKSLLRKM